MTSVIELSNALNERIIGDHICKHQKPGLELKLESSQNLKEVQKAVHANIKDKQCEHCYNYTGRRDALKEAS